MSYDLFRHLCDTLEIRYNSPADRDRNLYVAVRFKLGMGQLKPKDFFAQTPAVTPAQVLACFLDTMEPFAKMLESIYEVCSDANRGGTAGKSGGNPGTGNPGTPYLLHVDGEGELLIF